MLIWNSSVSYAIASIIMVILALEFFSWYRSNRNFIVLLYSISFIITSISIVSSVVFFTIILPGTQARRQVSLEPPSEPAEGHAKKKLAMDQNKKKLATDTEQEEVGHGPEQEEVGHGPEQEEVGHGPDIRKFELSTIRENTDRLCCISYCELFVIVG